MIERMIDRLEERLAPHTRAVSIAAAVWFWLGIAIHARFIPLPDMPDAVEAVIFWAGVAVNAIWWGFLRPAIEERRKARENLATSSSPPPGRG